MSDRALFLNTVNKICICKTLQVELTMDNTSTLFHCNKIIPKYYTQSEFTVRYSFCCVSS